MTRKAQRHEGTKGQESRVATSAQVDSDRSIPFAVLIVRSLTNKLHQVVPEGGVSLVPPPLPGWENEFRSLTTGCASHHPWLHSSAPSGPKASLMQFVVTGAARILVAALIVWWAVPTVHAQSGGGYVIKKSTIDGGGHSNLTDMDGTYRLGGTVGQHDARELTGGDYRMIGGFWSPQEPGGPPCSIASAPQIVQFDSNNGPGVSLVALKMNRYLGLRAPGSAGRSQAIRVEFTALPPPFDIWNGARLWVQEPVNICEVGGSDAMGPPCPGGSTATFARAFLGCSPVYRDWSTAPGGTVYVTHPGIVPKKSVPPVVDARYEIRMIEALCDLGLEANFSAPVQVVQTKYGDMAGPFDSTGGYYTAPEGDNVGVGTDVTSILNKFSNRAGAPIKPRADMEPCRLDSKINISDVNEVLNGFRNLPYRFAPGSGNCLSMDPCGYAAAEQ